MPGKYTYYVPHLMIRSYQHSIRTLDIGGINCTFVLHAHRVIDRDELTAGDILALIMVIYCTSLEV